VQVLKRAGELDKARRLLLLLLDAIESEHRTLGTPIAPWYYEQMAIVCHKLDDVAGELEVLKRYATHMNGNLGTSDDSLLVRLRKVEKKGASAAE